MNDDQITQTLERRAAQVQVGPPPLGAMRDSASRRRRGWFAGVAAGAAVAVIAVGTTLWPNTSDAPDPAPPTASEPPSDPDVPPLGHRYVGIGQAVIAVPADWPINAIRCTRPARSTVFVDVSFFAECGAPYPENTSHVSIHRFTPIGMRRPLVETTIDGRHALQSSITCEPNDFGGVSDICSGAIYLPGLDATFEASSTVSAEAVGELLSAIRVLDRQVAVPGFRTAGAGNGRTNSARYVEALDQAGLTVEVHIDRERTRPVHTVLAASPPPGTVVEPGTTVEVTVTDGP